MIGFCNSVQQLKALDLWIRMRESGVRHYTPEQSIEQIAAYIRAEMDKVEDKS